MALKKQRQRLSKKLSKLQEAGKEAFGKAATKANEIIKEKNKRPTTILVPSDSEDHHTKSPFDEMKQSMNAFVTQLGTNLQQGMEATSKYDYQVETSKDESTGATTTKIVTRSKSSGTIVASHKQVQETDGSMKVVTKQSLNEAQKGPFAAGIMPQNDDSLPGLPTEGVVEYTVYTNTKDISKYRVICKVESGPEAGKVIEYKVRTQDGSERKDPIYEDVRIIRQSSRRRYLFGSLSVVILAIAMFAMTTAGSKVLDALCMPTPPHWRFSSTTKGSSQWGAPWWVPFPYKPKAFRMICSTTSGRQHSIERFAVSWISKATRQQQLGVHRMTDHYDRQDGKYVETTSQTVHKKTGAIDSVLIKMSEVEIFSFKNKNMQLESKTISISWRAPNQ